MHAIPILLLSPLPAMAGPCPTTVGPTGGHRCPSDGSPRCPSRLVCATPDSSCGTARSRGRRHPGRARPTDRCLPVPGSSQEWTRRPPTIRHRRRLAAVPTILVRSCCGHGRSADGPRAPPRAARAAHCWSPASSAPGSAPRPASSGRSPAAPVCRRPTPMSDAPIAPDAGRGGSASGLWSFQSPLSLLLPVSIAGHHGRSVQPARDRAGGGGDRSAGDTIRIPAGTFVGCIDLGSKDLSSSERVPTRLALDGGAARS